MPTHSDVLALIERIVTGDEEAGVSFERMYLPRFESRARRAGIPLQDCPDVAQEVFLAAISQMKRGLFRGESAFGTWLDKIVRGKIIDYLRIHKMDKMLVSTKINEEGEEETLVEGLPDTLTNQAAVLAVREALDRMPTELRFILVSKMCEEWPLKQIASALGCSTATVFRKLREAEEIFRKLIIGDDEGLGCLATNSTTGGD